MDVDPDGHVDLPLHQLTAELAQTNDGALPLRIISLIHRRGVPVVELHLDGGAAGLEGSPQRFIVLFRSTERHARVLQAGFGGIVNVLQTTLVLDVRQPGSAPAAEWCPQTAAASSDPTPSSEHCATPA
jgi:hypothetical protein